MNKERIIELASQCFMDSNLLTYAQIERFANLVAAETREECAVKAENYPLLDPYCDSNETRVGLRIGEAIRNGGK